MTGIAILAAALFSQTPKVESPTRVVPSELIDPFHDMPRLAAPKPKPKPGPFDAVPTLRDAELAAAKKRAADAEAVVEAMRTRLAISAKDAAALNDGSLTLGQQLTAAEDELAALKAYAANAVAFKLASGNDGVDKLLLGDSGKTVYGHRRPEGGWYVYGGTEPRVVFPADGKLPVTGK